MPAPESEALVLDGVFFVSPGGVADAGSTSAWKPNPRKCRSFSQTGNPNHRLRTGWLGCQESNLGMAESKSAALPLGYTPTTNRPCGRLQPLMTLFRRRFNWERGHFGRVRSQLVPGLLLICADRAALKASPAEHAALLMAIWQNASAAGGEAIGRISHRWPSMRGLLRLFDRTVRARLIDGLRQMLRQELQNPVCRKAQLLRDLLNLFIA